MNFFTVLVLLFVRVEGGAAGKIQHTRVYSILVAAISLLTSPDAVLLYSRLKNKRGQDIVIAFPGSCGGLGAPLYASDTVSFHQKLKHLPPEYLNSNWSGNWRFALKQCTGIQE